MIIDWTKQWRENIWVVNQLVTNDVSSTKVSETFTSRSISRRQVGLLTPVIGATIQKKEHVHKISYSCGSAKTIGLLRIDTDSKNRSLITSTNITCLKTIAIRAKVTL